MKRIIFALIAILTIAMSVNAQMKNIKVLALQNTLDIELDFMDCFIFNCFPIDIEKTSFFDDYKYSSYYLLNYLMLHYHQYKVDID